MIASAVNVGFGARYPELQFFLGEIVDTRTIIWYKYIVSLYVELVLGALAQKCFWLMGNVRQVLHFFIKKR
jgi:hypothetical protein